VQSLVLGDAEWTYTRMPKYPVKSALVAADALCYISASVNVPSIKAGTVTPMLLTFEIGST